MKTLVSYVLQDEKGHEHRSEVLDFKEPPYTFSSDPPVHQVMKWAEEKQAKLVPEKRLILVSMYKM